MKVLFSNPNNVFNRLVWRLLPDCKQIVALASASLDKNLSLGQRIKLRLHMVTCAACLRFFEQSKFLREAMSQYYTRCAVDENVSDFGGDVRERLKRAVSMADSDVSNDPV
jgi:hypothetical protein